MSGCDNWSEFERMTPMARTLAFLRGCGHAADVVERWLPRVNVRRDLFHCIDIVAGLCP
jgi:hypothetical protein